jgi:hypothetical protein
MKREDAIEIVRDELAHILNIVTSKYYQNYDHGLVLFERLERAGLIRPPMTGDLKSQIADSKNKWED